MNECMDTESFALIGILESRILELVGIKDDTPDMVRFPYFSCLRWLDML